MILWSWFILLFFFRSAWADVPYCPSVRLLGERISFSDTEIHLFCGDPKSHAWKHIPAYQAKLVLRGLFQSRGYLSPEFREEGGVLIVSRGRKSRVKKVRAVAENDELARKIRRDVYRLFEKRLLTTKLLNSMEGETMAQIRKRGYPCGKVRSEVNVNTDTVTLIVHEGPKHDFGEISREPIEGLHEKALLRFYPMEASQRFNGELLDLVEKRLTRAEVVSGTYFLESCDEEGRDFSLEQEFITGPPRTLRYGAGASTEAGPMVRVRWSNNRMGKMASSLSATLEASFRVQSLKLVSDYYRWPGKPRRSFYSQLEVTRESQYDYQQFLTRLRPQMKWTEDRGRYGHVWIAGPSFENGNFRSSEKTEVRSFSNMALEASLQRTAHEYELYDVHPQSGSQQMVTFSYRHPALGFVPSITRLDTSVVHLGRLTNLWRGTLIGGVHVRAGSAFTRSTAGLENLPPEVKFFGGGSDDLRGFLLRTLPKNDGLGALTRVLGKFELRQTNFFHQKLEAFSFLDAGQFGRHSVRLDPRLWYSPGVGIRWLSPIGLVQAYWARSLATHPREDLGHFLYAGLGGTF